MQDTVAVAIISAGAALLAGAWPVVVSGLGKRRERKNLLSDIRRQKFELLLEHLDSSERWAERLAQEQIPAVTARTFPTPEAMVELCFPEHARRLRSVALVYFPQLVTLAETYFVQCWLAGQYCAQCHDPNFDANAARTARTNLGLANGSRSSAARALELAAKEIAPTYVQG